MEEDHFETNSSFSPLVDREKLRSSWTTRDTPDFADVLKRVVTFYQLTSLFCQENTAKKLEIAANERETKSCTSKPLKFGRLYKPLQRINHRRVPALHILAVLAEPLIFRKKLLCWMLICNETFLNSQGHLNTMPVLNCECLSHCSLGKSRIFSTSERHTSSPVYKTAFWSNSFSFPFTRNMDGKVCIRPC